MATKKTRAQLITESDATFLDNSTGQIVPENHRIYNDNVNESAANLKDANTFEEVNTFQQTIISDVVAGEYALNSEFGAINLDNGGIYVATGNVDIVGGNTNLNTAFIRVLKNCFKTTAITASGTLDLTATDGNLIYIEGDATIDSFAGQVGQIFYAIFTGNCLWDYSIGNIQPPTNFYTYPNDVLIFLFTSQYTIRVLGIHRSTDATNLQLNGQNYFEIAYPPNALAIASNNGLAVGATYRVLGAFEMPKSSGIFYDVYLRAKTPSLFEPTCYLSNTTEAEGVLQKAWFTGGFEAQDIFISDNLDASNPFTWNQAIINGGGGTQFAMAGAKAYIQDSTVGFYGDATFSNNDALPISQNLLDIQEAGQAKFGRIMDVSSAPTFIPHSGFGTAGTILWGKNWYTVGLPSNAVINSVWAGLYGGTNPTLITYYRVQYKVVNDICTVDFYATLTGHFDKNVANPRELWAILPTPFSIAADSIFSTGSVRIIGNHQDQGILCEPISTNQLYFKITSKHNSGLGNSNVTMSGSVSFQITG